MGWWLKPIPNQFWNEEHYYGEVFWMVYARTWLANNLANQSPDWIRFTGFDDFIIVHNQPELYDVL